MSDKVVGEPREGFQILGEMTKRYWRRLEMHASTGIAIGPGIDLPAVTVPQAQLDIQHAIREAFHAGAAFQASILPSRISFELPQEPLFSVEGNPRVDIRAVYDQLPARIPNHAGPCTAECG